MRERVKNIEIETLVNEIRTKSTENTTVFSQNEQNEQKFSHEMKKVKARLIEKENLLIETRTVFRRWKEKAEKADIDLKNLKSELFEKETFSEALKREMKEHKMCFKYYKVI